MVEWMMLVSLIVLPITFGIQGLRITSKDLEKRNAFYLRDIISSAAILLLYFIVNPTLFKPLDFSQIAKGIHIPHHVFSAVIPYFVVPLVLSVTPWDINNRRRSVDASEILGYPVAALPVDWRQYSLFVLYIVVGVVFEEALCRQFLFYLLNTQLGLQGDALVLVSALVFSIGHLYQGWKGVLSTFVAGILLGNSFLIYESIASPFLLHLLGNLTIAVIAFKRLKDKQNATGQKVVPQPSGRE